MELLEIFLLEKDDYSFRIQTLARYKSTTALEFDVSWDDNYFMIKNRLSSS